MGDGTTVELNTSCCSACPADLEYGDLLPAPVLLERESCFKRELPVSL